jgi:hypothetical protein
MLAQVLIAELAMWKDLRSPDGRGRVVRHGYGSHRAIEGKKDLVGFLTAVRESVADLA